MPSLRPSDPYRRAMPDGTQSASNDLGARIRAVLLRQSKNTLALPKVRDLKELKMTLADRFDQWAQQHEQKGMQAGMQAGLQAGMQKGIEQGIEKGEALVLQKLLIRRFGALPADLSAQIGAATAAQIDVWVGRVLDAQSLDEVFRP